MKTFQNILLIIILLLGHELKAQLVYLNTDLHVGSRFGVEAGLNVVTNQNLVFQVAHTYLIKKPESRPSDYSTGILGALSLTNPMDEMMSFQLLIGKIIPTPSSSNRWRITGGMALVEIREPVNWRESDSFLFLSPNYDYDIKKSEIISGVVNVKFEFLTSRFYGLSVSTQMLMNRKHPYLGIGFGQNIGVVKKKKPKVPSF